MAPPRRVKAHERVDLRDGLSVGGVVIYRRSQLASLGRNRAEREAEIERRLHAAGLKHGFDDDRIQVHLFDDGTVAVLEYRNTLGRLEGEWWVNDDPAEEALRKELGL